MVFRDFGFAPNPFFEVCTLATCKPNIRRIASLTDWIIGTGSAQRNRKGFLVFAMRVTGTKTFNQYWADAQFQRKKPNLLGSKKQAFGDNIYFKNDADQWEQRDSHHSYSSGAPNPHNIHNDTQTDLVLFSTDYAYWGGSGPKIPQRLREYEGLDICAGRNHKSRFSEGLVNEFVAWFRSLEESGYLGAPLDWSRIP